MRPTLAGLLASGRVVLTTGRDNEIQARADTWAVDPRCSVCGETTPSPERSAYLRTPEGPRVTCRNRCFSVAVARQNPMYRRTQVQDHAAEGRHDTTTNPTGENGIR